MIANFIALGVRAEQKTYEISDGRVPSPDHRKPASLPPTRQMIVSAPVAARYGGRRPRQSQLE
jgi:hypothetical protein